MTRILCLCGFAGVLGLAISVAIAQEQAPRVQNPVAPAPEVASPVAEANETTPVAQTGDETPQRFPRLNLLRYSRNRNAKPSTLTRSPGADSSSAPPSPVEVPEAMLQQGARLNVAPQHPTAGSRSTLVGRGLNGGESIAAPPTSISSSSELSRPTGSQARADQLRSTQTAGTAAAEPLARPLPPAEVRNQTARPESRTGQIAAGIPETGFDAPTNRLGNRSLPSQPQSNPVVNVRPPQDLSNRESGSPFSSRTENVDFIRAPEQRTPIRQTSATTDPVPLNARPLARSGQTAVPLNLKPLDGSAINGQPEIAQPGLDQAAASRKPATFAQGPAQIEIKWKKQGDINVDQECTVALLATNTGLGTAMNVVIDAAFPQTVRLTAAQPQPATATEVVSWNLNRMEPGEERRILISMIPSQPGEITVDATARFTTGATAQFKVEQPMLDVAMSGPEQVMIGEPATQTVMVTNPGTGIAHDVILSVKLPAGLTHTTGRRELSMEIGALNAGESRTVRLSLTAAAGGGQTIQVVAASGKGLRKQAESTVAVIAPTLELAVKGPGLRYVGRDATYTVNVHNSGETATNNIRALYAVPAGFEFLSAGRGGKYDRSTGIVTWFVGSLDAEKSAQMTVKLRPTTLGDYEHVARVVSEHGVTAESVARTKIDGIASLSMDVDDLDDPVEIGRETAYEIRLRSDGSKDAQNVQLSLELPLGVKLTGVRGPAEYKVQGNQVIFQTLRSLPAGRAVAFQIRVAGAQEGNQRLRARLTSDSIQEPLTVEELTRFYAD